MKWANSDEKLNTSGLCEGQKISKLKIVPIQATMKLIDQFEPRRACSRRVRAPQQRHGRIVLRAEKAPYQLF